VTTRSSGSQATRSPSASGTIRIGTRTRPLAFCGEDAPPPADLRVRTPDPLQGVAEMVASFGAQRLHAQVEITPKEVAS
jgi:hypothetical protein